MIKIPNVCLTEQHYSLDILIGEFLGLNYEVDSYEGNLIEITLCSTTSNFMVSKKITIDASFFHIADEHWLTSESMPILPLNVWEPSDDNILSKLVKNTIPVLYGQPGLVEKNGHLHLSLDIFGSSFFMLSRYEELITEDRDQHDRFPGWASVAFKAKFLSRPIVNEYLEVLWACLSQLWPHLKRKERKATNFITCDTDWPFDPALYRFKAAIKRCAYTLIKERNVKNSFITLLSYLLVKIGVKVNDRYRESIDWIMDVNEQIGNRVAFYFILKNTSNLDTQEDFDSQKIRTLFQSIASRGHEIGIHPGYNTYKDPIMFKKTVIEFKRVLREEAIKYEAIGGRQHFLRWDTACTPHLWNDNGLSYDSSLAFPDKSGFRSGVCYEYTMYDLINRTKLRLKQYPLTVMETTIISKRYESRGYRNNAKERFFYLKKVTQKYKGTFNLLWHNCHLMNDVDKEIYKVLIK